MCEILLRNRAVDAGPVSSPLNPAARPARGILRVFAVSFVCQQFLGRSFPPKWAAEISVSRRAPFCARARARRRRRD